MLLNTFIHIPRVGQVTEKKLWQKNIRTWKDVEDSDAPRLVKKYSRLSIEHFEQDNHAFFSSNLSRKHHWRAYPEFKEKTCFLDIETTGLSKDYHDITVIGMYDGQESKTFVQGINLDEFAEEIQKYSLIVTFNGALFDIPFIEAKFDNVKIDHMHVDLRFVLQSLGYRGGLKHIEKVMGIERESDLSGLTGWDAVRLWKQYKKGSSRALDTLCRYCTEDIENLKYLMEFSYETLEKKTFRSQ